MLRCISRRINDNEVPVSELPLKMERSRWSWTNSDWNQNQKKEKLEIGWSPKQKPMIMYIASWYNLWSYALMIYCIVTTGTQSRYTRKIEIQYLLWMSKTMRETDKLQNNRCWKKNCRKCIEQITHSHTATYLPFNPSPQRPPSGY